MLFSFVSVFCLGISTAIPVSNEPCTADKHIWFVFDYQPCSKLQDPTDRLGIYRTRRERCRDPMTDCCVTCEAVRQEYACENEHNGVTLADGTYACSKLTDVNDRLGIYKNRVSICQQPETRCCVTCKNIVAAADCELPNTGVYIADGAYPCKALLDPSDTLGIYKNRRKICDDKQTQCCRTCETVRQEQTENGTSSEGTTQPPTPAVTLQTITGGNPVHQACEKSVWIAGGAYDCSYLLDVSNKFGIYKKRREFCNNGIAQCCVTCSQVYKEPTPTAQPIVVTTEKAQGYTIITPEKDTPAVRTTTKDCERYVWVAGGSYECSYLLDPSNKFGIYQKRHDFCNNGIAQCCVACAIVRKGTPPTTSGKTMLEKNNINNPPVNPNYEIYNHRTQIK